MGSDRLKGQMSKAKRPCGYSTSGPKRWRGPQTDHKAWANTGMTDSFRGDVRSNKAAVEKHQGGRADPHHRHGAVPYGTHGDDGAVQTPRWSLRNPVGKTVANPPRKRRSRTI